jgi:hypothetical protein
LIIKDFPIFVKNKVQELKNLMSNLNKKFNKEKTLNNYKNNYHNSLLNFKKRIENSKISVSIWIKN